MRHCNVRHAMLDNVQRIGTETAQMPRSEQINVYVAADLRERIKAEAARSNIPSESLMVAILAKEALDARNVKARKVSA